MNADTKFFVWDGIECELIECDSIESAKGLIKEYYVDVQEGVHPDIDTCFILEKKLTAKFTVKKYREDYSQDEWKELTGDSEFDTIGNVIFE